MNIKIYDRDFSYSSAEVVEAQAQLNATVPGVSKERVRMFGRFELPLSSELTEEQQTMFVDWVAAQHPDWEVVFR
jgi:hypothetical protein